MSGIKCEYCNNFFKNNNVLKTHQLNTKYCIEIQNSNNLESKHNLESCKYCTKLFTTYTMDRHLQTCKNKKEEENKAQLTIKENEIFNIKKELEEFKKKFDDIKNESDLLKKEIYLLKKEKTYFENRSINYKEQLDKRIEEINNLQNRIEKMALKAIEKTTITTSTHNTIINNLPTFHSQEFINNKIQDKFDDRYFHNEMKSIAQFTYDHILKLDDGNLVYVCCDYGRKNFKYKDENGNEITDPEAIKLIDMIQDKLYDKTCYLHDWAVNEYDYLKMQEERDELVDKKEFDSVIDMIGKAQDMKMVIKSMNKTNKFSNELAKLTVVKK